MIPTTTPKVAYMPRFPVNFRRKSTVLDDQTGPVEPSFRVLDRSQVVPGHASNKSFDGGAKMRATGGVSKSSLTEVTSEDNLFADMKTNRYVGNSYLSWLLCDDSCCQASVASLQFALRCENHAARTISWHPAPSCQDTDVSHRKNRGGFT